MLNDDVYPVPSDAKSHNLKHFAALRLQQGLQTNAFHDNFMPEHKRVQSNTGSWLAYALYLSSLINRSEFYSKAYALSCFVSFICHFLLFPLILHCIKKNVYSCIDNFYLLFTISYVQFHFLDILINTHWFFFTFILGKTFTPRKGFKRYKKLCYSTLDYCATKAESWCWIARCPGVLVGSSSWEQVNILFN